MKKALRLFWQLLIFPVLFPLYSIFNTLVIVKQLGCGCTGAAFNANHFTLLFWVIVALTIIVISLFQMRAIERPLRRFGYLTLITLTSGVTVYWFYHLMLWR